MDIEQTGKDLVVAGLEDFNLNHIFECGQCFRWKALGDETYLGVAKGKALKISQRGSSVILYETTKEDFLNIWYDYFDLGTDYGAIKKALSPDDVMREASSYGNGIRILKQDLWETVVSFIISASNNIPRIKGIIERLCAMYGDEIRYLGEVYYSFPSAGRLAACMRGDLAPIRAGYRDKYILDAAEKFSRMELRESDLRSMDAMQAKKALMTITGVGNKVADCILLFGLSHTESFPVDVWVKRVMEYYYFDTEQTISAVAKLAEDKFADLGGYAQQYLFFYARENNIGK